MSQTSQRLPQRDKIGRSGRARLNDQIQRGRQVRARTTKRLSQQPLEKIALDRVAASLGNRQPQSRATELISGSRHRKLRVTDANALVVDARKIQLAANACRFWKVELGTRLIHERGSRLGGREPDSCSISRRCLIRKYSNSSY